MVASPSASRTIIALVVFVTVITGPVVGLTPPWFHDEAGDVQPGHGMATVEVVDVPERVILDRSEFGAQWYRLTVPPATVHVTDIEGRPMISYQVRIEALGTDQGSTTFLPSSTERTVALTMKQWRYDPADVTQESYTGEVIVTYRGSDSTRTLVRRNVTVEVRG